MEYLCIFNYECKIRYQYPKLLQTLGFKIESCVWQRNAHFDPSQYCSIAFVYTYLYSHNINYVHLLLNYTNLIVIIDNNK